MGDATELAASLAEVGRRVARARATLIAAIGERNRLLAQGTTSTTLAHADNYLRRLRRDLTAVRGEHLRAEARHRGQLEAVDAARNHLTLARAEREVVERHFAAWRAERRKLAERRDD
ncbi:MAG TPA: hypothetical protein VHN14_27775 [Kofleriaceae bacterium]|nr:hypothetical protein [Kofleriaceae bacterium]